MCTKKKQRQCSISKVLWVEREVEEVGEVNGVGVSCARTSSCTHSEVRSHWRILSSSPLAVSFICYQMWSPSHI